MFFKMLAVETIKKKKKERIEGLMEAFKERHSLYSGEEEFQGRNAYTLCWA